MRILLIDDNSNDRLLVRREIIRDHKQVTIVDVETREQLDEALFDYPVNLAVIDYSLGWGEGLTIFRQVRSVDADCAAIMYTGTLGEEHAVEAMKAGLDDYIVKDTARLPRLRASIHALLAQQNQRRAFRRAEARYRNLFSKVTVGLFACAGNGALDDGNPALLTMLGLPSVEALRHYNLLDMVQSDEVRRRWSSLPSDGMAQIETALIRPDRATVWVLIDAHPAAEATDDGIEGVLTDITALKTALEQKTILLKEVYHRVYNNLQLVESLLFLQEQRSNDASVRESFRDVSRRIRSLSLIQQKMYQGDDLQSVDFCGYVSDLTNALLLMPSRPDISVSFDLEPVRLSIDKATPLGLMINEILTNAVKHAFPEGRSGAISIKLWRNLEGEITLRIADNGVGADATAVPRAGLGSQLLERLARQVHAVVEVDRHDGFATTVRFSS